MDPAWFVHPLCWLIFFPIPQSMWGGECSSGENVGYVWVVGTLGQKIFQESQHNNFLEET